jgi:hypothetical protein
VGSGEYEYGRLATHTHRLSCPSNAQWAWGGSYNRSSGWLKVTSAVADAFWPNGGSFTATNWSSRRSYTVSFSIGCSATEPPWQRNSPIHGGG